MMNQSQSQMMLNSRNGGGGYGMWPDQVKYNNQNIKASGYGTLRNNKSWKGKKGYNDKRINSGSNAAYNPPTLKELRQQNRLKARRHFTKKKFNHGGKSAPFAPRNTTSFLIRAKRSGGITSLVSPCPVTPSVLPTPIFSPSREVLVDTAKEEWGVDGYGSMKGLIRLRSPGNEDEVEDEDDEGGSSGSDVEEHLEVERRLDNDLSRFEMINPNYGDRSSYILENRVDDQDTHIAQLEEENLMLKERLSFMEREFSNLRNRLQSLEMQRQGGEGLREEVLENDSENDTGSRSDGDGRSIDDNNGLIDDTNDVNECSEATKERNESNDCEKGLQGVEVLKDVGIADVYMDDNILKNKVNVDVDIETNTMEDHVNGIIASVDSCVSQ